MVQIKVDEGFIEFLMLSLLNLVFPMLILAFNGTNSSKFNENRCLRTRNQTLAKRGNMCSQATAETIPDVLPVEQG